MVGGCGCMFLLGRDIVTIHRIIVEVDDNPNEEDYIVEIDGSNESLSLYEQAPKNGWVPKCFRSYTWCIDDEEIIVMNKFSKPCLVCPFRLHKGKTKINNPEYSYGDYIGQEGH